MLPTSAQTESTGHGRRELPDQHRLEIVRDHEEEPGGEAELEVHLRRGGRPRLPAHEERLVSTVPALRDVQGVPERHQEEGEQVEAVRHLDTAMHSPAGFASGEGGAVRAAGVFQDALGTRSAGDTRHVPRDARARLAAFTRPNALFLADARLGHCLLDVHQPPPPSVFVTCGTHLPPICHPHDPLRIPSVSSVSVGVSGRVRPSVLRLTFHRSTC